MGKSSFKSALFAAIVTVAAILSSVQPALAALITEHRTGWVTFAEPGNPFGVGLGSPIDIHVTYDKALLTGIGDEFIEIDDNPAFGLTISLGALTFDASDDGLFGSGFPKLGFLDGSLATIDFLVDFSFGGYADLTLLLFESLEIIDNEDFERVLVAGTLGIPEPSSLALLAIGVAALSVRRRRRA
jgi:hypothetical protein